MATAVMVQDQRGVFLGWLPVSIGQYNEMWRRSADGATWRVALKASGSIAVAASCPMETMMRTVVLRLGRIMKAPGEQVGIYLEAADETAEIIESLKASLER